MFHRICLFLFVLALSVIPFMACSPFLDIDLSPQLIESENLLINEETAQSAVNGVYTHMRTGNPWIANGAAAIYGGLAADELHPSAENAIYLPFYRNVLSADNSTIGSSLWSPGYQTIFRCNTLLAGLRQNNPLDEEVQNRLLGELLTSRAFLYTYLAGFFENIPLVLSADYTVTATLPQSEFQEVMQQVADDLREARMRFGKPEMAVTKTRPTYWAATALLARISLYLGHYDDAATLASEVIDAGWYRLSNELAEVFSKGGDETIWEIAPPNGTGNTPQGSAFLPASPNSLSPILLTPGLIESFESKDERLIQWIGYSEVAGEKEYYPRKYRQPQFGQTFEYLVVLRLAELYLLRAEARFMDGDYANAVADLNIIRERAGATLITDFETVELLWSAIVKERRQELFAEWGHRWFDMRRWGIIDEVMKAANTDWQPEYALFPIPERQLEYNYTLIQNPGY
ncbi:MAG TPA: RagB/SusD family nutrient uptake outer membrane protein [Parapedobacter sp.]|nr:RagB/SusD family nutrient uptake outer membrane protein [Parapedobacter sp.]